MRWNEWWEDKKRKEGGHGKEKSDDGREKVSEAKERRREEGRDGKENRKEMRGDGS